MSLPEALQHLADEPIWLPYRTVARPNGKLSKPPVRPDTGTGEGWNADGAPVTYAEATAYAAGNKLPGVGIVMSKRTRALGLVGLDLDDARVEGGAAKEWARDIIGAAGKVETYYETSPSGQGFRMLALGFGQAMGNDVEVYDGRTPRFLTITGDTPKSSPKAIAAAPATVTAALARANLTADETNQGGGVPASAPGNAKPESKARGPLADVTPAITKSALAAVPASGLGYEAWIKIGQALHHQFDGSADGLALFDDWCLEDGARYKEGEPEDKWGTFGAKEGRGSVTMKFVLGLARDKGWKQPPRAASDAFKGGADAGGLDQWEAPLSLDGMKAEAPAGRWVPGTLPVVLERFAHDLADRLGGTAEAVLGLMVPVAGAMIPGALNFAPRGADNPWRVFPLFFAALVGPPGSMKTPIMSSLTDPIMSKQKEWNKEHKRDDMKWAREVARMKDEKIKEPIPPRPVRRRRYTSNATVEGHARLASVNNEPIITIADELATFFGSFDKYAGTGSTGGTDRGYWLSAYEGKEYESDRADTAKSTSVESVKASVIGGVQPQVFASILSALTNDGLAARFLFIPTGAPRMSMDIAADQGRAAIYTLVGRLILEMAEGAMGTTLDLVADGEAKAVSREAERFGLDMMATLPEGDPLRDIAAKSRGFVARITAALHIIEWATGEAVDMLLGQKDEPDTVPLVVGGATARKALAIWREFYWPSARQVYVAALNNAVDKDVMELAAFVKERDPKKESFTATDAGAAVRRFRGKGNEALAAATIRLEKARWLRRQDISGGARWIINPAVRTS